MILLPHQIVHPDPAVRAMIADGRIPGRLAAMRCDAPPCAAVPTQAPRVHVPPKAPYNTSPAWEHRALRMMTTLHYCADHVGALKLDDILTAAVKAKFETAAQKQRGADFVCDFDAAHIVYVSTNSPEYQAFLAGIEVRRG